MHPPPRTHVNITFFHPWDVLKTIFDVTLSKILFDLERSPKVKFRKNVPITFKLCTTLNKNRTITNMQKIMLISFIVYENRKFKVNRDKEVNIP